MFNNRGVFISKKMLRFFRRLVHVKPWPHSGDFLFPLRSESAPEDARFKVTGRVRWAPHLGGKIQNGVRGGKPERRGESERRGKVATTLTEICSKAFSLLKSLKKTSSVGNPVTQTSPPRGICLLIYSWTMPSCELTRHVRRGTGFAFYKHRWRSSQAVQRVGSTIYTHVSYYTLSRTGRNAQLYPKHDQREKNYSRERAEVDLDFYTKSWMFSTV